MRGAARAAGTTAARRKAVIATIDIVLCRGHAKRGALLGVCLAHQQRLAHAVGSLRGRWGRFAAAKSACLFASVLPYASFGKLWSNANAKRSVQAVAMLFCTLNN